MEKIIQPKTASEYLNDNLIKSKKPEKYILPKVATDFNKQQSERFKASGMNFSAWNMEMRKELSMLDMEIFDKWNSALDEQILNSWKKSLSPKESAEHIIKIFQLNKKRKP